MPEGTRAPQIDDLVQSYADLLYRYAYRLTGNANDAEDLTQQTFLRAQQKCQQLRDTAAAKWWLCSIMRNSFLTSRRHVGLIQPLEGIDEPACVEDPPGFDIDPDQLQRALLQLPEEFRSPLILFYFEEFSYQEIADQMGLPMGTVMSRLSRAKAFLRRCLSDEVPAVLRQPRERVAT